MSFWIALDVRDATYALGSRHSIPALGRKTGTTRSPTLHFVDDFVPEADQLGSDTVTLFEVRPNSGVISQGSVRGADA